MTSVNLWRYRSRIGCTGSPGALPIVTALCGTADCGPSLWLGLSLWNDGGAMTAPNENTDPSPSSGDLVLKSRAQLRGILMAAGLKRSAAEKICQGGWAALATEEQLTTEIADQQMKELEQELVALAAQMKEIGNG